MSEEFDEILKESGFKRPTFDSATTWEPEDYGFEPKKITDTLVRGDVYYKGNFELRRREYNYWLCRKKVINERNNTEYLQRFYLKIFPEEIEQAKWLLTSGLK